MAKSIASNICIPLKLKYCVNPQDIEFECTYKEIAQKAGLLHRSILNHASQSSEMIFIEKKESEVFIYYCPLGHCILLLQRLKYHLGRNPHLAFVIALFVIIIRVFVQILLYLNPNMSVYLKLALVMDF
jgi:hypothetical protein